MARIGFVGLGNMGLPMLANLVKAGHEALVFDLVPAALEKARALGAEVAGSAARAAEGREAVVTMLPAGRHVRAVYQGSGEGPGIVAAAAPDTLLIDCSTIDVASARAVAGSAEAAGLPMVDAPVSGGVMGAEAATLTFMVGGLGAAFERARPFLEAMGKAVVHTGGAGNGQAAKICNNMILGISMIGVCEAFVLAEKLGLSHDKLFEVSSRASGQCWSLTTYCPVPGPVPGSPANRDYQPGFSAAMMLKDLKLATDAAQSSDVATPLGAEAAMLYELFCRWGQSGKDFSGIIEMLRGAETS